jgi:hypothetical protein
MTTSQDPTDLPAVAAKLIETIDDLTRAIQDLLQRTARSETHLKIMWVFVALVVFLTGGMAVTYYQQVQTTNALNDTRNEVLCPWNAIFIGSYNPTSRAEGPDRDAYEAAFVVIRDSYRRLGCTTPFVPPPTSRSTPPK